MELLNAVSTANQMKQDGVSKHMREALQALNRVSFKGHIFKNLSDKQSDVLSKYLDSRAAGHMQMAMTMTEPSGDDSERVGLMQSMKSNTDKHDEDGHHGHHDHHDKEPSILTAAAAALINYMLMFGFCCAYGMIMFMDPGHKRHRAMAIKMNLGTAMLMGLLISCFSKVPVAIGGPDMNPVIFSGVFVQRISEDLMKQLGLEADPGKGDGYHRMLGASSGPSYDFCVKDHLAAYEHECEEYHTQLRATVIFAISVSSGLLALLFLGLGALKLTRYVAYVPTSIVDAFLSCMGYKVFKHGLKLCKYKPQVFIPAAAVGVPLYFLKANHMGNPAIIIPLFMLTPVAVFYALIYISGWDVAMAREDNLMFPKVYHEEFYEVWQDGFFNRSKINYKAWWSTKYDLLVMMIVCLLDCLVTALRTTEAKIPVKVKKNYETLLYGLGDIGAAVFGSTAGYMQLKMNVINYGIMGNIKDRRAGIMASLLLATSFFGSIGHINYIPRLFLGMLLFFGGSGFVAEHLWGSRDYLSFIEWMQVFIILGVFILTDEILYSVTLGGVLCGITFIAKYAKIPCISGRPMCGGEVQSREQHTPLVAISLSHIANCWLLVIRLKGFIFFASVQSVTDYVRGVMEQESNPENPVPPFKRVKYVLLDCELLDGLDSSAEKDIQHLAKDMAHNGVRLLWSHVKPDLIEPMVGRGTIRSNADWFTDIDDALLYIQGLGLKYRMQQQVLWERLHPAFELNQQLTRLRDSFEPFVDILRLDVERFGCPWDYVGRIKIQKCKTLLWAPGEHNRELFLVHTGAVGLFREIPGKDGKGELERPVSVYRHGWFLNRESIMRTPTRFYALALEDGEILYWNRHEWWRMHREQPLMASAILEAAMRQASSDMERMAKALRNNSADSSTPEAEQALANIKKPMKDQGNRDHGLPKDMHQLPEDLEARLEGIEAAQYLEAFGLYQPIPEDERPGLLPALPRLIQHDLEVAFQTYCVWDRVKEKFGLPWEKISEALMYAGIFNTLLVQEYRKNEPLTQAEFLELANEAALMRLSHRHITKIYNIFREYKLPGSELVSRDDLIAIFENTFMPHITEQEVNGIANTWEDDGSGMIHCGDFIAIISRFARRHEQDWNLLRGLREILNKKEGSRCTITDVLTVEKLCKFSSTFGTGDPDKDMQLASEMLWCAACYSKLVPTGRRGEILDWTGCCAAVLLNVDQPCGKLPPAPKKARENTRRSLKMSTTSMSTETLKELESKAQQPSMAAALMGTMGAQSSIRRHVAKDLEAQGEGPQRKARVNDDMEIPGKGMKGTKSGKPTKKTASRSSRKGGDDDEDEADNCPVEKLKRGRSFKTLKDKFQSAYKDIIKLAAHEVLKEIGEDNGSMIIDRMGLAVMDLRAVTASDGQRRLFQSTRLSRPEFEDDEEMDQSKSQGKRFDPKSDSSVPDTPDAKIYLLLEDPTSSTAANIWSMVMAVFILFSVGTLFLKSLISKDAAAQSDTEKMIWKIFECLFTIVFLSELVVRFAVAPAIGHQTYCDFIKQPLNVCDGISVLPFFIELAFSGSGEQHLKLLRVARLMRLARIARIARLAKKSSIAGPVAAVFTIIWGIYLKESG